jgi:hypothetical protein
VWLAAVTFSLEPATHFGDPKSCRVEGSREKVVCINLKGGYGNERTLTGFALDVERKVSYE